MERKSKLLKDQTSSSAAEEEVSNAWNSQLGHLETACIKGKRQDNVRVVICYGRDLFAPLLSKISLLLLSRECSDLTLQSSIGLYDL